MFMMMLMMMIYRKRPKEYPVSQLLAAVIRERRVGDFSVHSDLFCTVHIPTSSVARLSKCEN